MSAEENQTEFNFLPNDVRLQKNSSGRSKSFAVFCFVGGLPGIGHPNGKFYASSGRIDQMYVYGNKTNFM